MQIPTWNTVRRLASVLVALAIAACSDSANGPGRPAPVVTIEMPASAVAVGVLEEDGWLAVRGRVTNLVELDRLTYQVDGGVEHEIDVRPATGGEGTFDFNVIALALGEHTVRLRAHDRRGGAHVAPTIKVAVVPVLREIAVPDEAANSFPTAINERGDVTGYWTDVGTPSWHAFAYVAGETRVLGEQGEWRSGALGLNELGDVVGYRVSSSTNPVERAISWRGTTPTALFPQTGIATAINSDGVITGSVFVDADGPPRGFILRNGQLTVVGDAGRITTGHDVNAAGHVLFSSHGQAGDVLSFVYVNGERRQLTGIGGLQTVASSMNDAGVAVGYAASADGSTYRAFRAENGQARALRNEAQTDVASYAYDINNHDVVVGEMVTGSDGEHWAFIATGHKLVALETLIPGSPPLIAAYGISDRGEIAAIAISSSGWLRPVIVALPGGPEAVRLSVQARAGPTRRMSSRAIVPDLARHRERSAGR
jgi:uncharacterized membrane protein